MNFIYPLGHAITVSYCATYVITIFPRDFLGIKLPWTGAFTLSAFTILLLVFMYFLMPHIECSDLDESSKQEGEHFEELRKTNKYIEKS